MAQHFIVPPASNKNKKIISVVRISEDNIEIMEKGKGTYLKREVVRFVPPDDH